jgi:AcrR family transcriptional regulator
VASTGRPRDPQIDAAVLKATIVVLGHSGYAGLALEDVARRAGTSKPAIYRRWGSRHSRTPAATFGTLLYFLSLYFQQVRAATTRSSPASASCCRPRSSSPGPRWPGGW